MSKSTCPTCGGETKQDSFGLRVSTSRAEIADLRAQRDELLATIKKMLPWFAPNEDADDCEITYLDVAKLIARAQKVESRE